MKNIVKKSILLKTILSAICCMVYAATSADTYTYNFSDASSLQNDWNILSDIPSGGTGDVKITNSIGGSLTTQDGNYLGFTFLAKSQIQHTITSTAYYQNISQISAKACASDNSKPTIEINIVDDNGTVISTPLAAVGTKSGFNTGGTKKWGSKTISISSPVSGHLQFVLYASSSGKYAALDDIEITYTGGAPTLKSSDATLKDLKVNGQTISGFAPTIHEYSYTLPASQSSWPQITAIPNDSKATYTIQQPTNPGNPAVITVTAEDGTQLVYKINYIQTTEPTITGFTIAGVSASINQTQKKITATVPNGTDITNLTPVVTLTNADSYTPTGAQNFSNEVTYTAIQGSKKTAYTVQLTVAPPKSNDATLSSISVNGSPLPNFQRTTYSYTYELPAGTTAVPTVTATPNAANTMYIITPAASLPGNTTIKVTAEDGTEQIYTITFKVALPSSNLTCHEPEIYEADTRAGGYGTPLVNYNGREYEVYYLTRVNNVAAIGTTNTVTYDITTNATPSSFSSKDGWIEGTMSSLEGGVSTSSVKANSTQEFMDMLGDFKIYNNTKVSLRIKGYDQFRIVAKDNNATETKGKHFEVYIDNIKQPMNLASSATLRSFDISTDEHIIVVEGVGGSNNYLYGFSLRVSDAPRVKYVTGDDKTQVINQTKQLAPITYAIRNYVSARLEWIGAEGTGITLTPANTTGDTLQVSGTANCPVGEYTYRVVALDKNGAEASSCTGMFRVQTEVRATNGTEHTVWINDPITPAIIYEYDALNDQDVTFGWGTTPVGVTATQDVANSQWSIVGTPTTAGTYTYTLTAQGGNTLTGKLIVDVPEPQFIAPADSVTKAKATQTMVPVTWTLRFAKNATVTGLPNGVQGTYNNGILTISGTPAAETSYPKTYTYTITAEPLYAEKSAKSTSGKIIIIDPNAKSLLYLYKDNYDDGVYKYLNQKYDVTARVTDEQVRAANQYDVYDLIVLSENIDATNGEALDIVRHIKKPVFNLKGFMYTTSRLGWGYPDNGSINATDIIVTQPTHPVFQGMGVKEGTTLQLIDAVNNNKGLMPVETTLGGSLCLATAPKRGDDYYTDGAESTFLHEVPASLREGKYMLMPLAQSSSNNLTATCKRLIDNIITYLLTPASEFSLPDLRITSFSIDGRAATIDETKQTIRLVMPEGTNLSALTPEISLSGTGTYVSPGNGETVDFSDQHYGINYVVSDYINKRTYQVIVSLETALEEVTIDGVWFDGQTLHNANGLWLNIFDTTGRLISTTNSNMDCNRLPSGMYLVQSTEGTLRFLR